MKMKTHDERAAGGALVQSSIVQVTPAAAVAITPASTAPAVRKVSLAGIGKKEVAKPAAKYPTLVDDADHEVSILAEAIRTDQEQFAALEGALKVNKARLRTLASPFYFKTNHGRHEVPSSVRCEITEPENDAPDAPRRPTGAVLVTFQNRYGSADESAVAKIVGEKMAQYFRQKFEIKIDGDLLPAAKAETLVPDLLALFERHGCTDALSSAEKVVPTDDFHIARHSEFTPEQNAQLELVLPIVVQVKTKNVQ